MSLFGLKIGNKNIDKSKSLRENINETILQNITNSNYTVRTSASINQNITIDCSDAYLSMIQLYAQNKSWGAPQTADEFAKGCSLIGATLDADITLNVNSSNAQDFSSDLENNIKRDFKQMDESITDKNWVEVGGFNKTVNESENIQRIIDNVEKSNIRNIVYDTVTNSNINQSIDIKFGTAKDVAMRGKIALVVTAVSDAILKDVDKTLLDTNLSQLKKKQETDQISRGIVSMFGDAIGAVNSAIGAGAGMFIGFLILVGVIAIFAPFLFCFIPGINVAMGSACKKADVNKSAYQSTLENRRLMPPQGFQPQGFPPQGFPPQGFPPQGFPPQGFPPQGFPPQGFPQQGVPQQGFNNITQIPFGRQYGPIPQYQNK
jgi:hypothetical protein